MEARVGIGTVDMHGLHDQSTAELPVVMATPNLFQNFKR